MTLNNVKQQKKARFDKTGGQTNRRIDRQKDRVGHSVAFTQLKIVKG